MPKYSYISRDAKGQRLTAVADSPSRSALLADLKGKGMTVVEVQEVTDKAGRQLEKAKKQLYGRPRWTLRWIDAGEMAVFWREFATMIAAGLPVVEALESIAQETEHGRMRKILTDVVSRMWEGFTLSQGLARHPQVFPPMVVALMGAAEESGALSEICNQLADYLEKRDRLIRKVRAALTYPIFLSGFFIVVVAVATFWLIPQFKDIYSGFDAKLPLLTEWVFAVNEFVLTHSAWIIGGLAVAVIAIAVWATRPTGRAVLHRLSLKIPVLGPLFLKAAVARFCRSLAILLAGGIPVNRAFEMAQETSGNSTIAGAIGRAREAILRGGKIAPSLKEQDLFPHMMVRMTAAGEETGNLSGMLEKTSEFYESRVDAALTTINSLIEPIMIIVIGAFVLLFVLALYMPIFMLAMNMKG
ncbi:MAG TPA: type II secretion system F family protein [Opitutaceae bacterium]